MSVPVLYYSLSVRRHTVYGESHGAELGFLEDLPTDYTEWQRLLTGLHSIMMEKLAQAFTISTITYKVVVYAPAERADTSIPPISTLSHIVLCGLTMPLRKQTSFCFVPTRTKHYICNFVKTPTYIWCCTKIFLNRS
jgi:hypothetical protein